MTFILGLTSGLTLSRWIRMPEDAGLKHQIRQYLCLLQMQMQMFGPGYSLSADKLSSLLRPIAVGSWHSGRSRTTFS